MFDNYNNTYYLASGGILYFDSSTIDIDIVNNLIGHPKLFDVFV